MEAVLLVISNIVKKKTAFQISCTKYKMVQNVGLRAQYSLVRTGLEDIAWYFNLFDEVSFFQETGRTAALQLEEIEHDLQCGLVQG